MKINKVENLDFETIYKVLNSNRITESEKTRFILSNRVEIKQVLKSHISNVDFKSLMKNRTLQKFRPFKNSYTKRVDKIILAKALNVEVSQIPLHIKEVTNAITTGRSLDFLEPSTLEILKTFVYRHGTKDELVAFLDLELTQTKDLTKRLYKTLEYYTGGIADYFIRPIHKMDNKTLVRLFHVINKHIKLAKESGEFSDAHAKTLAKFALIRLYELQNNSKLKNAIKTYKTLK